MSLVRFEPEIPCDDIKFTPKCLANPLFSAPATEKKQKSSVRTEAVRQLTDSLTKAQGHRFAIVIARFNEIVIRPLMNGALDTFDKYSVREEDIDTIWVPGVFEIGLPSKVGVFVFQFFCIDLCQVNISGPSGELDGTPTLPDGRDTTKTGCYSLVAEKLEKSGKYNAILCIGTVVRGDTTHYDAVANSAASGVLSAGLKSGNKGSEAALTAIEMASLFEHHMKE
nr:6,7-dimethyl-8-ribityllumazine synthase, chloroplastic [Tanacetum cinerariifolium]